MKAIVLTYILVLALVLTPSIKGDTNVVEPVLIDDLAEEIPEVVVVYEEITVEEVKEIPEENIQTLAKNINQESGVEYRYIEECPLSEELQQGIFEICEENNVSFEFVMAVMMQESSFRPDVTGDSGHSKGLMQIQERYHSETMKELGVTDLYDPLGNAEVGVKILRGYFEDLDDVYHVLMRYNGGEPYASNMIKAGKVSDYAKEITERAIRYEEENGI